MDYYKCVEYYQGWSINWIKHTKGPHVKTKDSAVHISELET